MNLLLGIFFSMSLAAAKKIIDWGFFIILTK
jgi:hypothetical protein